MIAEERETTITYTDADKSVSIYTCRRQDITALKHKLSRGVVLVAEGNYADGTAWARFEIPRTLWRLGNAVKRQVSEANRARGRQLYSEHGFGRKTPSDA